MTRREYTQLLTRRAIVAVEIRSALIKDRALLPKLYAEARDLAHRCLKAEVECSIE